MVRSCLIDVFKAFDRIDHNILLHKLELLNVRPILLNWCAHFSRDRQLRVKLGNSISTWKPVHVGVPQETKLGPLFFLVMIIDLSATLPLYKYVDDVTVFESYLYRQSSHLFYSGNSTRSVNGHRLIA